MGRRTGKTRFDRQWAISRIMGTTTNATHAKCTFTEYAHWQYFYATAVPI